MKTRSIFTSEIHNTKNKLLSPGWGKKRKKSGIHISSNLKLPRFTTLSNKTKSWCYSLLDSKYLHSWSRSEGGREVWEQRNVPKWPTRHSTGVEGWCRADDNWPLSSLDAQETIRGMYARTSSRWVGKVNVVMNVLVSCF